MFIDICSPILHIMYNFYAHDIINTPFQELAKNEKSIFHKYIYLISDNMYICIRSQ